LENKHDDFLNEFLQSLKNARQLILDPIDIILRNNEADKQFIRSRVLNALGKSGLEGQIRQYAKSKQEKKD